MKTDNRNASDSSTASFGRFPGISPLELTVLSEHKRHCQRSSGHLSSLHWQARMAHDFLASHMVTTLVLLLLLVSFAALEL